MLSKYGKTVSSLKNISLRKMALTLLGLLIAMAALAILLLGIPRLITELFARSRTYSSETAPKSRVAIVFGAGLTRDGSPSAVLEDRVKTAADLYFAGKVEKILMSGDNRFLDYNEPGAMADFAIKLGVPTEAIVLDFAGRRTYDTCYRAGAIFEVNEAILVTQKFHLPRALFLCNNLGVKSIGVAADRRPYRFAAYRYWQLREIAATVSAFWEVWVSHPLPVLGDPEPIFPHSDGVPSSEMG